MVAAQSIKRHYEGRVTAGHATAMGSYNDAYAAKLYRILRRAGVTIVVNPLINITIQGRFDSYPKRRGMAGSRSSWSGVSTWRSGTTVSWTHGIPSGRAT